jgi:hypothetical protein
VLEKAIDLIHKLSDEEDDSDDDADFTMHTDPAAGISSNV